MNYLFILLVFTFLGLFLSISSYITKQSRNKIICLVGDKCSSVVESKYAKTLGVSNELLGILYYGLLVFIFLVVLFAPFLDSYFANMVRWVFVTGGVIFVLYLLYLQRFVLKKWCSVCLLTTSPTLIIFAIMLL